MKRFAAVSLVAVFLCLPLSAAQSTLIPILAKLYVAPADGFEADIIYAFRYGFVHTVKDEHAADFTIQARDKGSSSAFVVRERGSNSVVFADITTGRSRTKRVQDFYDHLNEKILKKQSAIGDAERALAFIGEGKLKGQTASNQQQDGQPQTLKEHIVQGLAAGMENFGRWGTSQNQNGPEAATAPVTTAPVIESRIDGEFTGWEGATIFKLLNGQIWQQSSYAYRYRYRYSPKVLIYKSGAVYKMKVDGVDGDISVSRLK